MARFRVMMIHFSLLLLLLQRITLHRIDTVSLSYCSENSFLNQSQDYLKQMIQQCNRYNADRDTDKKSLMCYLEEKEGASHRLLNLLQYL